MRAWAIRPPILRVAFGQGGIEESGGLANWIFFSFLFSVAF
jgi:hypothetical protein